EVHGASSVFFEHGLANILFRLATLSGVLGKTEMNAISHNSNSSLSSVFEIVEERLGDDLRVFDMAIWAGVDTKTLTRMFKRETGKTPFAYLTSRRVERAKTLLRKEVSVTETALAVGYANPAKFSAAFRRSVGVTPSEWARVQITC
ncbi:MAG: AraC family transcriptional regulator, partial [Pseudomonadota bacterium]